MRLAPIITVWLLFVKLSLFTAKLIIHIVNSCLFRLHLQLGLVVTFSFGDNSYQ